MIRMCLGVLVLFLSIGTLAKSAKPNVLVSILDDGGWQDVGSNGGEIKTPGRLLFEGINTPNGGELTFSTVPSKNRPLYSEVGMPDQPTITAGGKNNRRAVKEVDLDAVGAQQSEFEHL